MGASLLQGCWASRFMSWDGKLGALNPNLLVKQCFAHRFVICAKHLGRYHGFGPVIAFLATEVAEFAEHQAWRKTYRPDRNAARIERDGAEDQPGHRPRVDPDRPAHFAGRPGAAVGPWKKHRLANRGTAHR